MIKLDTNLNLAVQSEVLFGTTPTGDLELRDEMPPQLSSVHQVANDVTVRGVRDVGAAKRRKRRKEAEHIYHHQFDIFKGELLTISSEKCSLS